MESEEPIITNDDEEIDIKINELTDTNFTDFESDIKYDQIAKKLIKDLNECKQKLKILLLKLKN